ncbi:hypothetical protein M8494_24665 [Serratia ureilytica]
MTGIGIITMLTGTRLLLVGGAVAGDVRLFMALLARRIARGGSSRPKPRCRMPPDQHRSPCYCCCSAPTIGA